mmetsp:Transcript_30937/g.48493  ORF Transcript_30937/g.48493 Transcript_30937/m.48493 type:complete len:225 (-) Transcript_30937:1125-1799(-)
MAVVFKLGMLTIRSAAKPIASVIKGRAKTSPFFKDACTVSAQQMHQLEMRLNMYMRGQTVRKVKDLNQEVAVKNGAEILGEAIMLGIATAVLLVEHHRSTADSARKKADQEQKFGAIESRLLGLESLMKTTEEENVELLRADTTFTKDDIQARMTREHQRLQRLAELNESDVQKERMMDRLSRLSEEIQRLGAVQVANKYMNAFMPLGPSSIPQRTPPPDDKES